MRRVRPFLAVAALLMASACATRPPASNPVAVMEFDAVNDPLEPANRVVHQVNDAVDAAVLRPAARAYRAVLPRPVRIGIGNALGNLRAPVVLLNDLLQGEPERAGNTFARFAINTTLGLGGVLDVARDEFGLPGHTEDFGQTLAVWGLDEGPYLVLPLLGPSGARDLVGTAGDVAADPFGFLGGGAWVPEAAQYTRTGLGTLNAREGLLDSLEQVRRTSLDPYATLRSAYRQRRRAQVENRGEAIEAPP